VEFPHLRRDTRYPYLDNVDVYSFVNNFDYTRWSEKTRVTLCNVNWNSDYRDVVAFESNDVRDGWFDSIEEEFVVELEQAARIVPEGFVKLPIPYDVMARFNYLFIDMPIATDSDHMIDYENIGGIRRWYFFIDEIAYRAPNTTEVRVSLDIWTNYSNDVAIKYMMLERGHAPVAYSDVDEYLSNPLENNRYLLSPDVNFGSDTKVTHSHFMCFSDSTKYLVFITTTAPSEIDVMGAVQYDQSNAWTAPTYADYYIGDSVARYGEQLLVYNYEFGDQGDYRSLYTPAKNGANDRLPSNVYAYAVLAQYCFVGNFLSALMRSHPNFINSIVTTLVVPSEMITLGTQHTIVNVPVYEVVGASQTHNMTLTKSLFNFPSEYQNFAKLYTFPYSVMELTDNDGKKIEVKIENTGQLSYTAEMSLAYPFLNLRVFFDGINGEGSESYTWRRIDGISASKTMGKDDWFEHCFDWPIPTYAIYMDGKTNYNLTSYNGLQNERRDALVGYHNSMRGANNARANAVDLANTAESNVNAEMVTLVNNMNRTRNTQEMNAQLSMATANANMNSSNKANTLIWGYTSNLANTSNEQTNACIAATTTAQNETSVATTDNSAIGSVVAGGLGGTATGIGIASGGGAAALAATGFAGLSTGGAALAIIGAGALLGAATSGVTAAANHVNATTVTQCSSTVAQATANKNDVMYLSGLTESGSTQTAINENNKTQTHNNNQCIGGTTDGSAITGGQIRNTTNCERDNTDETANTTNANAARTRGTSNNNSDYTRLVAELNAKEILENAQNKARARYDDARNIRPVAYGSYSGDSGPDYYETRGIQVKVRTQSVSAIRQAGDTFARYGYALNQVWDVEESGLVLMRHFTYWKASDIWTEYQYSSNNYVNRMIEDMFLNGVTIWSDPDEIGKVNIYDN